MEETFLFYVFETHGEAQFVLDIINGNMTGAWDDIKQRVTDGKFVISYVEDPLQQWRFVGVPEGLTIEAYEDGWWGTPEE